MTGRRFLSIVIICLLIGDAVLCDEPTGFVVKRNVSIKAMLGGQFALVVDAGRLPSQSTGRVDITLVNGNSVDFSVDELKVGCSCSKASLSTDSIAAFSSAKLSIDLETPSTSQTAERAVSVRLVSAKDSSRSINVLVKYQLDGLMCFKDEIVMREISPEAPVQRFSVPFVLTSPVKPGHVKFRFTPHSEGMLAELTAHGDSYRVDVAVDPVFVTADESNVTLTAVNEHAGLRDTVVLSLISASPIKISPSRTVFQPTDSGWEASSILRVESEKAGEALKTEPYVEVRLDGEGIRVESKKLAEGIFRLKLRSNSDSMGADEEAPDDETPQLDWRVTTNSGVHTWETKPVFLPSSKSPSPTNGAK